MFAIKHAERNLTAARAIHERAETENRDLSVEERSEYDGLMSAAQKYAADAERDAEMASALAKFNGDPVVAFRSVVSDAAAGRSSRTAAAIERRSARPHVEHAVLVPSTSEYRAAQAEGTDAAGGFLVPIEQAPVIVERLAPESVVLAAGPRLFTMTSDTMTVPKVGTGATVGFVLENAAIPEGNIVFEAATLTARKLAGLTRSSNEWLNDAIPDGRTVVEQHLLRELAIKLDDAFFNGTGVAPQPLGILNWPGVVSTPGAATLDDVAAAIAGVEAAYASPNAIFISPANWSALRLERDAGATGGYVLQPDASAATRPVVFGVPVYITAAVGTSIVVADMRFVGIGVRDRWVVHYDPYRYSEYDQSAIRVTSRWAIAPLHTAAVQIVETGALAARDKPAVTTPAATTPARKA
ncbi:phage major capsid protein, HK97 family [Luteitalea pratensis]|uniref:Phage major capsid protein, HK97 family n=1 Tax=Luteitalea pratensis TaxID=1855912 RepID=A0A143PPF0_LUTPR|nr:phage major capsid protein [Luteitalea pratensis]AMY10577.1 phage major capsid protein, HK97 family [Luteitalea pratensis]